MQDEAGHSFLLFLELFLSDSTHACTHTNCRDPSFLQAIGLDDLSDAQLGATVESPGEALGRIDPALAAVLGIPTSAIVAIGTVDAFAGLVGSVGAQLPDSHNVPLQNRLAVIMGTSTCHLCLSTHPHFVRGVWGPFRDAVGNGMWVAEGGQSATGKLLDHVLTTHPAWGELQAEVGGFGDKEGTALCYVFPCCSAPR